MEDQESQYFSKRMRMVEEQITARGVRDVKVLDAKRNVPRHVFVPENLRQHAYEDHPLSIGQEQTISQPYIVAFMTEMLALKGHEKVLEVGTGCGYQTAVLAEICQEVSTIETLKNLSEKAQETLASLQYRSIVFKIGDGHDGWPEASPFDAIIVTAAAETILPQLIDQLKVGGKMIIPVGTVVQRLYLITKLKIGYDEKELCVVRFVPMVKSGRI